MKLETWQIKKLASAKTNVKKAWLDLLDLQMDIEHKKILIEDALHDAEFEDDKECLKKQEQDLNDANEIKGNLDSFIQKCLKLKGDLQTMIDWETYCRGESFEELKTEKEEEK